MNNRLHQIQNWQELARQAKWSAALLAKLCQVSVRTLHRYFIKQFHTSTRDWLAAERQRQGLELLPDAPSIKSVAGRVGYKYPQTFSREFKRHWGKCPSEIVLGASPAHIQRQVSV